MKKREKIDEEEEKILKEIQESEKDFAEGRWKVLRSLKDLR